MINPDYDICLQYYFQLFIMKYSDFTDKMSGFPHILANLGGRIK